MCWTCFEAVRRGGSLLTSPIAQQRLSTRAGPGLGPEVPPGRPPRPVHGGPVHHRASGIGHRASGIGHRASGIGHRASGIGHRASIIASWKPGRVEPGRVEEEKSPHSMRSDNRRDPSIHPPEAVQPIGPGEPIPDSLQSSDGATAFSQPSDSVSVQISTLRQHVNNKWLVPLLGSPLGMFAELRREGWCH